MLRGICVTLAMTAVLCVALSSTTNACDKKPCKPVPVPAVAVACPNVPCCPTDASVIVIVEQPAAVYSEAGLRAFASIFSSAATKGVENATIRAFNATKVCPPCKPCDEPKK